MYKPFDKSIYKPRFFGYSTVTALVIILDGLITFFVGPFGYSSRVYSDYCEWNVRKDMARRKVEREAAKQRMLKHVAERKRHESVMRDPEYDYPGLDVCEQKSITIEEV